MGLLDRVCFMMGYRFSIIMLVRFGKGKGEGNGCLSPYLEGWALGDGTGLTLIGYRHTKDHPIRILFVLINKDVDVITTSPRGRNPPVVITLPPPPSLVYGEPIKSQFTLFRTSHPPSFRMFSFLFPFSH